MGYALPPELVLNTDDIGDVDELVASVSKEMDALRDDYEAAVLSRGRTTVGASHLRIDDLAPFIARFIRGEIPKSPRKGLPAIPLLKLAVEDLEAYYTETRTYRDKIDNLELMGSWFWENTSAGRLLLSLEAMSLVSSDRVMLQIVEMSLMAPRFWSNGPLPGSSAAGW